MKFRHLLSTDIGPIAFAIYRDGLLILRNPAHRALFSPEDIPAIPENDQRAYYFEHPTPHLAVRNTIMLDKKIYSLFSMLPLEEDRSYPPIQEEATDFIPIRSLFSLLLAIADGACTAPIAQAVAPLFEDCCAELQKQISTLLRQRANENLRTTAFTLVDREGLVLCLSIAISCLALDGCEITASLDREVDGAHTMTFLAQHGIENEFHRAYLQTVAAACGFSLTLLENGIRFHLPYHQMPVSYPLHALSASDDRFYIALGKLLAGTL